MQYHNCSQPLPIGVLHLGVKTEALRSAGFRTTADIRNAVPEALARLPLIGWRTVDQLVTSRSALAASTSDDGKVDWRGYCRMIGVPLIPLAGAPETGEAFLASLSIFFDEVAAHLSDPVLAVILRERICQSPSRQLTLEEIAASCTPAVTRERIRQKEKKLLRQLTGGLLNDSYDGLDIHFYPGFSRWWRIASDALANIDEIDVQSFVNLLCDVWDVSHGSVMQNIPIILAIVTGEPQMSCDFRSATRLNARLFGTLSSELMLLPLSRLRIGKHSSRLIQQGCHSFGHLVTVLRSGDETAAGRSTTVFATQHLNLVARCLKSDGTVDWSVYREAADLPCLPASPPAHAKEFAAGVRTATETLLRLHNVTKRAPDIFVRRTCRDAADRMTLQRVADELHTHLPTIKSEETFFLGWLHDVLVEHDFSSLRVWLDESWLRYWSEALVFYDETESYSAFADNLAWRWRLTGREVREAVPLLWAVLDGYPDGRSSGYKPPVTVPAVAGMQGRIRLKGFRRLH